MALEATTPAASQDGAVPPVRQKKKAVGGVWKRLFDIIAASLILVTLAPLLILIAVCVKLEDRGSIIFRHRRIGHNGASFGCFKFRTMSVNSSALLEALLDRDEDAAIEWRETQKLKNDPRVTRFGKMLRITSFDELPQLFNVLRGEMSLVGPRPVTAEEIARYGIHAEEYRSARPGLTGTWQVSGRNLTTYDERVAFDVKYVRHHTFGGDLKILAKTVVVVVCRDGAF